MRSVATPSSQISPTPHLPTSSLHQFLRRSDIQAHCNAYAESITSLERTDDGWTTDGDRALIGSRSGHDSCRHTSEANDNDVNTPRVAKGRSANGGDFNGCPQFRLTVDPPASFQCFRVPPVE